VLEYSAKKLILSILALPWINKKLAVIDKINRFLIWAMNEKPFSC